MRRGANQTADADKLRNDAATTGGCSERASMAGTAAGPERATSELSAEQRARQPRLFLSVGHDEYWSGQQRSLVAAARENGVNLGERHHRSMRQQTPRQHVPSPNLLRG